MHIHVHMYYGRHMFINNNESYSLLLVKTLYIVLLHYVIFVFIMWKKITVRSWAGDNGREDCRLTACTTVVFFCI